MAPVRRHAENGAVPQPQPFVVFVPVRFILLTLTACVVLAFGVGQAARFIVTNGISNQQPTPLVKAVEEKGTLPHPILSSGKKLPHTVYTSKHYDTGRSVTSDSLLARQQLETANEDWVICSDSEEGDKVCHGQGTPPAEVESDSEEEEGEHEPAGQHLLVDIENVDGAFLNSKERLAGAMMDLVNMSGLTMLSYHCHELEPTGVSCAGVLLESHVSFHTWPTEGVITLDLFTCGPASLVPYLPVVEDLFKIPRKSLSGSEANDPPHMMWSYKRRGFRNTGDGYDASAGDIYNSMLGVMEFERKTRVASLETEFQEVEIFDLIHPRFRTVEQYERSLSNDGSYESKHPELFKPDRLVYLDGVLQSRRYGEIAYHESLVHPAMFTHENPQRVAIIGGGEGATLREVLKHDTVKQVTMIEIDKGMVDISKEFLKEWSDCSDLVESADSCFDDPRARVYFEDAIKWFIDNFSPGKETNEPKLDVIIMDALDPGDNAFFSDLLFNNINFARAIQNSLNDDGIFIAQTGSEDAMDDPSSLNTRGKHGHNFQLHLAEAGFESIREYGDANGGFSDVWSFFVAFESITSKVRWLANEAEVNLAIKKRARKTKSGKSSFKYFDGATMQAYHYPARPDEVVFCRTVPDAHGCDRNHGIDQRHKDFPITDFEVKTSTIENAGRGVFAKVDIPKGSYLAIREQTKAISFPPESYSLIYEFLKLPVGAFWEFFDAYLYGYGFVTYLHGGVDCSVDPGIHKFQNHGCNGTYNIGPIKPINELNADENHMPEEPSFLDDVYNSYADRNSKTLQNAEDYTNRDIAAGEEILDNFLNFAADEKSWKRYVTDFRAQCTKTGLGAVSEYEVEA